VTPAEHAALPDRVQAAKTLLAHARTGRGYDVYVPRAVLHRYVTAAEDVIERQANMLVAELSAELTDHDQLQAEINQLRNQNAALRDLVDEAITAGQHGDGEAISIIRTALERTA